MTPRDVTAEAKRWPDQFRADSPLRIPLANVDDLTLMAACELWWKEYTYEIRCSLSSRRPERVDEPDARRSAARADEAVLRVLELGG